MKSLRKDKRGHWPRGKSRNRDLKCKREAIRLLKVAQKLGGKYSLAEVERQIEVSKGTVARWVRGTRIMSDQHYCQIANWLHTVLPTLARHLPTQTKEQ